MNSLAFWITAMVIIGSVSATDDLLASNRIVEDDEVTEELDGEGRTCHNCHGGGGTHEQAYHEVQLTPDHGGLDGLWGLGLGKLGILIVPIIGLNIAIVVLLAIILKHLVHISEGLHSDYDDTPVYAGYTSYQAYDHGGAAANAYGGGGASTYGGGAGTAYGHHRRNAETSRNLAAEPSTMEFLAKFVKNSIDKYSEMEAEQ